MRGHVKLYFKIVHSSFAQVGITVVASLGCNSVRVLIGRIFRIASVISSVATINGEQNSKGDIDGNALLGRSAKLLRYCARTPTTTVSMLAGDRWMFLNVPGSWRCASIVRRESGHGPCASPFH